MRRPSQGVPTRMDTSNLPVAAAEARNRSVVSEDVRRELRREQPRQPETIGHPASFDRDEGLLLLAAGGAEDVPAQERVAPACDRFRAGGDRAARPGARSERVVGDEASAAGAEVPALDGREAPVAVRGGAADPLLWLQHDIIE